MGTKPQEYRWIIIDKRIRDNLYPNNRTLAEEIEVSRKTIQRDIEYMKYFKGAPIAYDPSRKGYYYTEENYRLPAIDLKESELFTICIINQIMAQYKNTPLQKTFKKVFEKIKELLPDKINVDPSWIDSGITVSVDGITSISQEVWESIAKALAEKKLILINYRVPGTRIYKFNKPYS